MYDVKIDGILNKICKINSITRRLVNDTDFWAPRPFWGLRLNSRQA